MRRCNKAVALIGFLLVCVQPAASRAVQTPAPAQRLLDQFETARNFDQQFEFGTKLVALKDPRVLEQLTPFLAHQDRHARGNAAFVFAALNDDRGLEVLITMLTDTSERILGPGIAAAPGSGVFSLAAQIRSDRYYAVHLLGTLKDPRALPVLNP